MNKNTASMKEREEAYKKLISMPLHQTSVVVKNDFFSVTVVRVPNGWLYVTRCVYSKETSVNLVQESSLDDFLKIEE